MTATQMHLDDELIQRLVHGELATRDEAATARHLEGCAACRLRLAEAEREEGWIIEQLRRLDHPMPEIDMSAIVDRAQERAWTDPASSTSYRASAVASIGAAIGRRPASRDRRTLAWARWAAGLILLLVAASVAYAVPGSPVRAWASRMVGLGNGGTSRPPEAVRATPTVPASAGIAVAPSNRFVIRFISTQRKGFATVSLTDGADIIVNALDGTAAFTSETDHLTIDNGGSDANYEIDLPRAARWIEIVVGGRRVLLERAGKVVSSTEPDSVGQYVLPLTSAAPE